MKHLVPAQKVYIDDLTELARAYSGLVSYMNWLKLKEEVDRLSNGKSYLYCCFEWVLWLEK